MDGSANQKDQLEELASATREYAGFWYGGGWALFVGAAVAAGAGVAALLDVPREWAPVEVVLGASVQVWALRLSRRWYQRRGAVVAPPAVTWGRRYQLGSLYFLVALQVVQLGVSMRSAFEDPLLLCGCLAAAALLPGLYGWAARSVLGNLDSSGAMLGCFVPAIFNLGIPRPHLHDPMGSLVHVITIVAAMTFAVGLAWQGATRHLSFRRLQRRLDTLRPAASPEGSAVQR